MAIGLMVGLGSAAGFNLNLGKKEPEEAKGIAGTAFTSLLLCGILICILVRLFLQPLMVVFGATEDILSYAMEYSGITSFGRPFLLFSTGTNPLVRGAGNARYSMAAVITGAILNIILDYEETPVLQKHHASAEAEHFLMYKVTVENVEMK